MSPRAERRAYALMAVTPAPFAADLLTARAVAGTIPPIALAFWRMLAAVAPVALVAGRSLWSARHPPRVNRGSALRHRRSRGRRAVC